MSAVETVADLEQMLTVAHEGPCEARDEFHARYGFGEVRYLVHQHCNGCGCTDRHWTCEGCAATTAGWVAQDRVVVHVRCQYRAPISEFFISIVAAR